MLKKLMKMVTNNFGLKILGIVFAIILWMVVVNVEDPDKSVSFSIPVDVVNTDYLTDMGKTYEILNDTDTISFTVTGQRSIVETLSASDFKAVANIENIDDSMSMVPIVVTATSYSSQLEIVKRNSYLLLNVENSVTAEYEIEIVVNGTPATGCFVDAFGLSTDTATVTGPESVVETIAAAQVTVDVSDATEAVSATAAIVLVDENGSEVSQDRLTLDETTSVVTAEILMSKEVVLSFTVTGEPADGYRYTDIEYESDTVMLEGDWAVLNALDALTISSSQLSVAGVTETVATVIHLPDYLPEGVALADGQESDVTVTILIESQTTVEVEMPVSNITVSDLADGLTLSYNSETATVLITGYEEDIALIQGENVYGTLDASGLETGTYNVALQLDGDYGEAAEAIVSVTITDDDESATTGDDTSDNAIDQSLTDEESSEEQ
ncbi:MAG: hypothetical protein LUD71_04320 [Clostridiales bacterium]|nr:hypothetical protein [Clostridiales bacterium]